MSSTALVRLAPRRRIAVVVGTLLVSFLPTLAQAADDLPSGGNVVAGQATIGGAGNNMLITQSSENAIINWDGFSIGAGNNVAFQNGSGATLNRVTGTNISTINGGLTATGSLFLINQNGVIIGEHGVIETGGSFVASTLDIANEDFLNGGDLTFSGDTQASVINLGKVSSLGGDVAFIARNVINNGSISAANGTAALVAGHEVLMRDAALNDGKFVVKLGDASSSIIEAGMIAAASVELRANGGNVYALAGNKGGAINATGVSNSGGRIFLTAPGGRVTVKKQITAKRNNGAGGDIFINADIVAIANLLDVSSFTGHGGTIDIGAGDSITLEGATLDASGYTGGGSIRVGGEYQGGKGLIEDEVQNVQTLLIDELTTLKANGTGDNADGGTIIAWADVDTNFNGSASATATGNGTGGFVETSAAHLHIGDSARVTTLSQSGITGTWLLDPDDFIVAAAGGFITGAFLSTYLDSGNITIQTSGAGADNGDIFINDDVSWSANTLLTLNAVRDVNINANVTATGTNAGLAVNYGGDYNFATGQSVTLSGAGATLAINGQAYTLIHNVDQLQDMGLNHAGLYALAEDIDASATSGWNSGAGFDPVGTFTGNFNGHGHTITELFINRPGTSSVGLFDRTSGATIANVGMIGGSITGNNNVGGLVGSQRGSSSITNAYATGAVSGYNYVGGLVGVLEDGSITNAYATGAVSGHSRVGGLVGEQYDSITNAYATGAVSGDYYVGGLVGVLDEGSITNAYATGAVTGTNFFSVGGLVGMLDEGSITNAYATGAVSGNNNVGGLVGSQLDSSSITNSYATGAVSGDDEVGGLVGEHDGGNITSSFWNIDNNPSLSGVGSGSQAGSTGLTTAEFQDTAGFMNTASGWDFENVWAPPGGGYNPRLYTLSRVVWVQADDLSRAYGSANPTLTANVHGGPGVYVFGLAGDTLDITSALSTTATAGSDIGTYAISKVGGNLVTSNLGQTYDMVVTDGALTVTPVALTITANDDTKTYDGLAYTGGNGVNYAGFVNGEDTGVLNGALNFGGSSQGATNAGDYAIIASGQSANNYTVTFVDGTLTLFPVPGMQTNVSSFADDGNGFGQNIVCADEELLSCELVEAQF